MHEAQNDKEATLLFHCRAGRGRTGMMMVMRDMVENAKKYELSFDQILKRQELLGSPDFSDVSEGKEEQSIERFQFLNHFYEYVLAADGYDSELPYSQWLQIHPIE
jgi:protein tyrosine phosphatase